MSRETSYRLFFNNEPATCDQLDRVDSITVEQEVDLAWHARLEIPICIDAQGRWTGMDENFMRPWSSRVRIEVSNRGNAYIPIIDGPVIGVSAGMRFEPGQSTLTLTVQDDSVYLDRDDQHFTHDEGESISNFIEETLQLPEQISRAEVDPEVDQGQGDSPAIRENGTAMQVLQCLARQYSRHVYVLPGERPGESVAYFQRLPQESNGGQRSNGLPPLILLGEEANMTEFNVDKDATRPAQFATSGVNVTDKNTFSSDASFRDHEQESLGDRSPLSREHEPASRLLTHRPCQFLDSDQVVATHAEQSGFALRATGQALEGCYSGVLQPYRLVTVRAGGTGYGGSWVINRVTHTLTRSNYSQSFALIRNAETEEVRDHSASQERRFV